MTEDWGEDWEPGWDGHARWQRRYELQFTPVQRLEWLEAAMVFVHRYAGVLQKREERPSDA